MPETAAITEPLPLVLRSEEMMEEIASLVVVAFVVVELPEILRSPVKVEEALEKIIDEVVAETPAEG